MRICIDLSPILPGRSGGIETVVRHVLRAARVLGREGELLVLPPRTSRRELVSLADEPSFDPFAEQGPQKQDPREARWERIRSGGFDLVHTPYQWLDPLAAPRSGGEDLPYDPAADPPYVANLHDFQHEHLPEFFTPGEIAWRRRTYAMTARLARAVIVIAEHVRRDVIGFGGAEPARVRVLRPPPAFADLPPVAESERARVRAAYGLPARFALYPAKCWKHKNHARLLEAVSLARGRGADIDLVLTGEQLPPELAARAAEPDLAGHVHGLGYVPYADVRVLYSLATLVSVPTLFEATSGPVHEALGAGAPVAASRGVADMDEVVGDAGLLFDPLSPESMAEAVVRIAADAELARELSRRAAARAGSRTWRQYAGELWAIYEKAASE
jgi:glycosyltransferase involved in cell wall biosynthesis